MKSVKIADLKDHLSQYLRAAERGEEVVVTDRNRPIARITPMADGAIRARLIPPTQDFSVIRDRPRTPAGWTTDSTALLLEERGER